MTDVTSGASILLYQYICQQIVGSVKHVNTIRMMNLVRDALCSDEKNVVITSGSFGEGLEMRGSDVDFMFVDMLTEVIETIPPLYFSPSKTYFAMMTEDTNPGFAMLCLIKSNSHLILSCCERLRRDTYLSNGLYKQSFIQEINHVVHGPCLTDTYGFSDFASCLRSRSWVKPASQWITRSTNTWPNEHTKQSIIQYGVLFVPVGTKCSPNEDFEWRISFSVAEKLLIHTFSHAQLLCYALMKILLKDVINIDKKCKDLLCSYYLKTIIFWISEELPSSVWTPDNLIPCFMRCFRRLIYCVQYQVCPHYFISENNLFSNRIEGQARELILCNLKSLSRFGWRCIFFSKQISFGQVFSFNFQNDQSFSYFEDINKLLMSKIITFENSLHNYCHAINQIIFCRSRKLKYIYTYYLSVMAKRICKFGNQSSFDNNKNRYKRYNRCLGFLLINTNHDAVSGWLVLASFFYKTNQYGKSLKIITYALSKCTCEKLFLGVKISPLQYSLLNFNVFEKKGIIPWLKFLLLGCVKFHNNPSTLPKELRMNEYGFLIPPVVYAHYLSVLCYYKMNSERDCRDCLRDLQLTISESYFIGEDLLLKAISYYCLGSALELMKDNESAKLAFAESEKLFSAIFDIFETHTM